MHSDGQSYKMPIYCFLMHVTKLTACNCFNNGRREMSGGGGNHCSMESLLIAGGESLFHGIIVDRKMMLANSLHGKIFYLPKEMETKLLTL